MKIDTDEILVSRIVEHDVKAFQLLYDRYCLQLIAFADSYLPDKSDAEEVVQAVFVRLWEKRQMLDPEQSIKAYLYKK